MKTRSTTAFTLPFVIALLAVLASSGGGTLTILAAGSSSRKTTTYSSSTVPVTTIPYWAKAYRESGTDAVYSIVPTSDGGYVAAGSAWSSGPGGGAGATDAWVFKLDSSGNILRQKMYGGASYDQANSISPTNDGGYIVAGTTLSFGLSVYNAWVFKLDSSGNLMWQKTYGSVVSVNVDSIALTSDGGYVAAGSTLLNSYSPNSAAWIFKLDSTGNLVWQKMYENTVSDAAYSIAPTSDGGYFVAAATAFSGYFGTWVFKLDGAGSIVWQNTYDLGWSFSSVRETSDGSYIVVGIDNGAFVLKLDGAGNFVWKKDYGAGNHYYAQSVARTGDGGYVVAGYVDVATNGEALWAMKIDGSGNIVWQKTYSATSDDRGLSVASTSDGGYIIAGITHPMVGQGQEQDALVLKLDGNGNIGGTCSALVDSSVTASTPAVTVANTSVTPKDTTVTPATTNASVFNSIAQVSTQCSSNSSYSISGHVTDGSSNPIPNATISASPTLTTITDASGYYTFTNLIIGTYTITPSMTGYTFSPPSHTVTVPPNATAQDFTGTRSVAWTLMFYLDGDNSTDSILPLIFTKLELASGNPNVKLGSSGMILQWDCNTKTSYYNTVLRHHLIGNLRRSREDGHPEASQKTPKLAFC